MLTHSDPPVYMEGQLPGFESAHGPVDKSWPSEARVSGYCRAAHNWLSSLYMPWSTVFSSCLSPAYQGAVQSSGAQDMSSESGSKYMSDKQLISKAVQRIFFLPSTLWERK
jgi:hypothetical protein